MCTRKFISNCSINVTVLLGSFFGGLLLSSCIKKNNSNTLPQKVKKLEHVVVYAADEEPESSINFIREQSFGDAKKVFIKRIRDVEIDSLDRVYIGERGSIHVYKPNGAYIKSVGQNGRGPGEFESLSNLEIRFNNLVAYDVSTQVLSSFSLDSLSLQEEMSIRPDDGKFFRGQFYFINKNSLLLGFEDSSTPETKRYIHFYKLGNLKANQLSKVFKFRIYDIFTYRTEKRAAAGVKPFSPTTIMAVSNNNFIYTAYTESFLIKKYNEKGSYLRAFFLPLEIFRSIRRNTSIVFLGLPKRLWKV